MIPPSSTSPSLAERRRQQYVEELEAATLRALAGDPDWHYRRRRLHHGSRAVALRAPHLRLGDDCLAAADYRGVTDALALRVGGSDDALHEQRRPEAPEARLIYDLLEQLRVESCIDSDMPGMARNVRERFSRWSLAFHHTQMTESALGLVLFCVIQICWSRLMARPVSEEFEDLLEATRANIVPVLGHDLAGLRRHRQDQSAYQVHARGIADWVGDQLEGLEASAERDNEREDPKRRLALLLDADDELDEEIALAPSGHSRLFHDQQQRYRAFTTAYDSEIDAASLVREALLQEYRERLDARIAAQRINVHRLARLFRRTLSQPDRDGWQHGEESGIIDGRRLAQVISSPMERRVFQRERYHPVSDAQVCVLIDCSGSMKAHGEAIATLVELLTRALDMAGVATEVLGFTTAAWNGGRAHRDWQKAGRPKAPGRLNEARHLVFKDARRPWRRSRRAFGALLKADLYKEGIDGEAVEWAAQRLLSADVNRRLLLVLSDGSPSDSATSLANDRYYLDNHLKAVIDRYDSRGPAGAGQIEITGLGVGLDLSPYYRRHRIVDLAQTLDNALAEEIAQLLVARHHY
ncbi:cobaltochelatase CobT-related protein [Halomonas sp. V046]|uniref:cobaltochelatase CobT-related protein n=1 Tax=Halomonas sp. V046 TaxID=3459611 RepID=UPI0040450784